MGKLGFGRLFVYFAFLMENKQNTPKRPAYNKAWTVAANAEWAAAAGNGGY